MDSNSCYSMNGTQRFVIALLGAYFNVVAFGFQYGGRNHADHLAVVNWLRNPALYPGDVVVKALALYPTVFWRVVAYASAWVDTQHVVLIFFLLTKLIFFTAVVRLVGRFLNDFRLVGCIVFAIALSPLLNGGTPFGSSDILHANQTQTPLAMALLLWVGCFLVERRWVAAALVLGLSIYVNVLFVLYNLFAFAVFALLDWRRHRRQILIAAALMGVVALPWLVLKQGMFQVVFPGKYVETLLMHYPFHLTLRAHRVNSLLAGTGILAAAAFMVGASAKHRVPRDPRLELLAGVFLLPVLLGVLIGEIFTFPQLVRLQFLRADSFLMLYAVVLVQIYGARLLFSAQIRCWATALLVGVSAILLPLSRSEALAALLVGSTLLVVPPSITFLAAMLLTLAAVLRLPSIPAAATALVAIVSGYIFVSRAGKGPPRLRAWLARIRDFFVESPSRATMATRRARLAAAGCGLALTLNAVSTVPAISRLWDPVIPPDPQTAAWREVQYWAKSNTAQEARFMVPPLPEGFRAFSERTIWVDYKDGDAIYTLPQYATEWRRRMQALGIDLAVGEPRFERMIQQYKEQSWQHLRSVANQERIDYIVQFADVHCNVPPAFRNEGFAVYKVLD